MDTLLAVIGILGLGALLIAAWVFYCAARRYVSGALAEERAEALASDFSPFRDWSERAVRDRRRNRAPVIFPITIDGKLITQDRRRGERRQEPLPEGDAFSAQSEASSSR